MIWIKHLLVKLWKKKKFKYVLFFFLLAFFFFVLSKCCVELLSTFSSNRQPIQWPIFMNESTNKKNELAVKWVLYKTQWYADSHYRFAETLFVFAIVLFWTTLLYGFFFYTQKNFVMARRILVCFCILVIFLVLHLVGCFFFPAEYYQIWEKIFHFFSK